MEIISWLSSGPVNFSKEFIMSFLLYSTWMRLKHEPKVRKRMSDKRNAALFQSEKMEEFVELVITFVAVVFSKYNSVGNPPDYAIFIPRIIMLNVVRY